MTAGDTSHAKTVIFLGAGASAADGAPLQGELLQAYFQSEEIQSSVNPGMRDSLRRFFYVLWGITVDNIPASVKFPTFEEALGILDIADTRKELFRGMGDDPHVTGTHELRNHLTALIGLILEERLRQHGLPPDYVPARIRELTTTSSLFGVGAGPAEAGAEAKQAAANAAGVA